MVSIPGSRDSSGSLRCDFYCRRFHEADAMRSLLSRRTLIKYISQDFASIH
ncbi:MAG: hypothetical protein KME25_34605 [Symplocastrum torsivum CPER-KK1]|uniref:Uncharacterized protein n=1 Tax=Symplocastrum torsivum CPER-KK1 TaxID=450513 RepID=A0A951PV51_9CYAN|nr:hypothetical protein [Symplocastrum torsivum CPER-KK1]